jgi:Na+/H+ antiporter NhaD/arsenite permease-like protein
MFVDNVVTILMMAPVALPLAKALKLKPVPVILMIGFGANFMGTALIIGDLPPQMLHSVAGAEFFDFIWQFGRPSSFPILMTTFPDHAGAMYAYGFRGHARVTDLSSLGVEAKIPNPLFATVVVVWFLGTVVAMSMREHIGVQLGFIAMTGALVPGAGAGAARRSREDVEFRGGDAGARLAGDLLLHRALRAGGRPGEEPHPRQARRRHPARVHRELCAGSDAPLLGHDSIVGLVEHDAYILTFLYTIKDMAQGGIEPWPLWWMLLWSGTLGSNLTVAGAPALYVAPEPRGEGEGRKVSLREFLAWSVPFTIVASLICYVLGMLIWVLPYAK